LRYSVPTGWLDSTEDLRMNDKRTTPGGGRRSKRAAPTIDLAATEVQSVAREPMQPAPESVPAEPVAETSAGQAPPQEPPSFDPPRTDASNDPSNDNWASVRRQVTAPVLAAGFAGAAIVTILLFSMWLTGLVPIRYAGSTAIRARVAALEMETQALQNRAAPVADTKAIAALTERVNAMQDAIAKLPAGGSGVDPAKDSALAERVAAADNAMKSLGLALAALNKRNDDIAGSVTQARERAEVAEKAVNELRGNVQDVSKSAASGASSTDIDALQKRIAALEQSTQAARDQIANISGHDTAVRLAISTIALRYVISLNVPYAAELAQAKSLGMDEKVVAVLAPYAETGFPTATGMAQELRTLIPVMAKLTGGPPPTGGFVERLQANAGKLVRVTPVDAPRGDDPAAVLSRLEIDAARVDLNAALIDLAKLPDAVRAPAQNWIEKAKARQAAFAAVANLGTARTLGSK
jgi:hypothetical protein